MLLNAPEGFFFFATALVGLLLVFLIPPFQTPDESTHLYRIYEMAEFQRPIETQADKAGSMLPKSIRQTELVTHGQITSPAQGNQIAFNTYNKFSPRLIKVAAAIPLNNNDREFYSTGSSPTYFPLSYLPQAIVAKIGILLQLPVLVTMYMIRILNLAVWLAAGVIAIRMLPIKKWTIAAVCVLPVVLSQSVAVGLDSITFASFLLFLTYIMSRVVERKSIVSDSQVIFLATATVVMVANRSVLVAFLPLIFLIKDAQFKSNHPKLIKIALLATPIFCYLAWGFVGSLGVSTLPSLSSAEQLHSLIFAPWHFFHMLFNTIFFSTPSGALLAVSIIGNFGYLDAPMSPLLTGVGFVLVGLILLSGDEQGGLTKKAKLVLGAGAMMYLLGVFLAMFLYFSIPSDNHIRGVQGRYFMPVLVALPFIYTFTVVSKQKYVRLVKVGTTVLLIFTVLTIFLRYYVNFVPS
jgi:uncharacterized membrane protein